MEKLPTTGVLSNETETSDFAKPRLCAGTKLISMTRFVYEKEVALSNEYITQSQFCQSIIDYSNFLRKPIALGMFVPCDQDNNLWTHPPTVEELEWAEKDSADAEMSYRRKVKDYILAQDRIIFPGFELNYKNNFVTTVSLGKQRGSLKINFKTKNIFIHRDRVMVKTIEDLVTYGLCVKLSACT